MQNNIYISEYTNSLIQIQHYHNMKHKWYILAFIQNINMYSTETFLTYAKTENTHL